MTTDFKAQVACWILVYGPGPIQIVEVSMGNQFTTGQESAEYFTTRDLAVERALALDPKWVDPEPPEPEPKPETLPEPVVEPTPEAEVLP